MTENTNVNVNILSSANGTVSFAPDVLSTIAGLAIAEVDGVANTTGFSALLAEKLSKKQPNNIKNITRGIKVEVIDGSCSISASVMVEYGHSVPDVAKAVQENIKKTIETMTGMNVSMVDVKVTGLSFTKENKEAAELEYAKYLLEEQANTEAVEETVTKASSEQEQ